MKQPKTINELNKLAEINVTKYDTKKLIKTAFLLKTEFKLTFDKELNYLKLLRICNLIIENIPKSTNFNAFDSDYLLLKKDILKWMDLCEKERNYLEANLLIKNQMKINLELKAKLTSNNNTSIESINNNNIINTINNNTNTNTKISINPILNNKITTYNYPQNYTIIKWI